MRRTAFDCCSGGSSDGGPQGVGLTSIMNSFPEDASRSASSSA